VLAATEQEGMDMMTALRRLGRELGADAEEDGNRISLDMTLAQRKDIQARILRYRLDMEVDEDDRTVLLFESLWEKRGRRGLVDLAPKCWGVDEPFQVDSRPRNPGLIAQVRLFSMRYPDMPDVNALRERVKWACQRLGYTLRHLAPLAQP
jgi:hypothetical protein